MVTTRLDLPPETDSLVRCTEVVRSFVVVDAEGRRLDAEEYTTVFQQIEPGGMTTIRSPHAFRLRDGRAPLMACADGMSFVLEARAGALKLFVETMPSDAPARPIAADTAPKSRL